MKNMAIIGFISKVCECLLIVLFTFMVCRLAPSALPGNIDTTALLKPITHTIDPTSPHNSYKLAPGKYILLPPTMVYECLNQHIPKRIFKYKLPSQTLKGLYKKNRVAVFYNKPINLNRKQVDLHNGNKPFDLIPGKKIWQLLRQNEAHIPPFFIYRMQRGDYSLSDDPLSKGILS